MKGFFITVEGIEGSGKSTQTKLLAPYLETGGRAVTLTREPGGTPIGDEVRKILLDPVHTALDPKAELLLYAASRAQHIREIILPALEAGRIVLCDRFSDATLAYQGHGRGLDREMIRSLDHVATGGLRPDLTLLLDIETATGLSRARGRNSSSGLDAEARFENEALSFHERVRKGYLLLAKEEPERFQVIDASLSPENVQAEIRRSVDAALNTQKHYVV